MQRCLILIALLSGLTWSALAQSLLRDSETETLLNELAAPLLDAADLPRDWPRIRVIDSPFVNAFVTNGNDLYVHAGLFRAVESAAELQAVLAHEIGHLSAGHLVSLSKKRRELRTRRYASYALGLIGIGAAIAAQDSDDLGFAVDGSTNPFSNTRNDDYDPLQVTYDPILASFFRYSRTQEHVADQAAIRLLATACLNPQPLLDVLSRLKPQALYPDKLFRFYLNTHPAPDVRLRALETGARRFDGAACADQEMAMALISAQQRRFNRVKAKVLGYVDPLSTTVQRYGPNPQGLTERYGLAHAHWRGGDGPSALDMLSPISAVEPENPFVDELFAAIYWRENQLDEARAAIERAVAARPNDPLLALTRAQIMLGDPALPIQEVAKVVDHLELAVRDDPENPLLWDQKARAHARLKESGLMHLALAERFLLEGDTGAARHNAGEAVSRLDADTPAGIRARDLAARF